MSPALSALCTFAAAQTHPDIKSLVSLFYVLLMLQTAPFPTIFTETMQLLQGQGKRTRVCPCSPGWGNAGRGGGAA